MLITVAVLIGLLYVAHVLRRSIALPLPAGAPTFIRGLPIVGSLGFFSERWHWFKKSRDLSKTGNFSYVIGPHQVIGMSGVKGREVFFSHPDLGFAEGYEILFAASPTMDPALTTQEEKRAGSFESLFQKRLVQLLKRERLSHVLKMLIADSTEAVDAFGNSGTIDPFEDIYRLVFRLTIRVVGAREIAENPAQLQQVADWFDMFEKSTTASGILFPTLPTISKAKRIYSGARLYFTLKSIIDKRKTTGTREEDALQVLMDHDDSLEDIIKFLMGSLFAGVLNSGINACYLLAYLGSQTHFQAKAREEIAEVAAKYTPEPSLSLYEQLQHVPIDAWETEFPFLDACLRDSIRLNMPGTAFRKNIGGKDIKIGNEIIPPGATLTYAMGDVHLDPEIYAEPSKWDPLRYAEPRSEDKKAPMAYLGWGVARHPCLGMRFAKLEMNAVLAFFIARFNFTTVDAQGRDCEIQNTDVNAWSAHKPSKRVYLKYSVRAT